MVFNFDNLNLGQLFHLSFATKLSRNSSKSDFSNFFEKPISTENVAKLDFRTFRPRSGERVPDVVSDAETQSRQIRKGHCPRRWSQDPVPLVVHFLQVTNHSSVHLYMTGIFTFLVMLIIKLIRYSLKGCLKIQIHY